SQGIVQTLLYLSDNLDVLMTLFNDATQGIAYFSDRLNSTDPSTIDAVKNAVVTAYDAIKTLISTVVDVGDVINDVFYTGLDVLFGWSGVISGDATESVNGLAVVINVVSVAIGALSDGVKVIGIGFKGLVGLMYDLAAAATWWAKIPTSGDLRAKLDADYEILSKQRDKYYAEAEKDINEFQSKTQKAIDESTLNAEQANQKKIASNKETLAKILIDEAQATKDIRENAKRQIELQAELAKAKTEKNAEAVRQIVGEIRKLEDAEEEAVKSGKKRNKEKLDAAEALATASMAANQGVLTDLAKEDLLRDGIIAKINEQGNLEVSAYEDTEKLNAGRLAKIEALSLQQDALLNKHVVSEKEAGQAIVQNDADVAAMRVRLNKQALDARQVDDFEAFASAKLQIDGLSSVQEQANSRVSQSDLETLRKEEDIAKQKVALAQQIIDSTDGIITAEQKLRFEAQGLTIEYDKMGKAVVAKIVSFSDAAKALGVNISQALNLVSSEFTKSGQNVDIFADGLRNLGATGKQAADATYQAWLKWLETAKSQAEIDAAKAKLKEFGVSGQLSTQQVEMGMQAVKRAIQEIPASMSPVEAAFERLGIKTKEQLKLAADLAINDFNTIMKSGEA
ncbi:MAG: hypothetical protein J6N68_14215, partial [Shewanella sp.]|nr:hypothetical protein [Shewanella sp.]